MRLAVRLRVATVQLNPQIGELPRTVRRARDLLASLESETPPPDLVVFPEFALTGYNFHSRESILARMSEGKGASLLLASEVSLKYGCYTVIGYPEKAGSRLYNSAMVVGPHGKIVFNYRKTFLYDTEYEWGCSENPLQFQNFYLKFANRAVDLQTGEAHDVDLKSAIGICMDLSPYKFEAPFHDYEFATFNLDQKTELMICPMAWLHSTSYTKHSTNTLSQVKETLTKALSDASLPKVGSQNDFQLDFDNTHTTKRVSRHNEPKSEYTQLASPDITNINYWLLRFLPFLSLSARKDWFEQNILASHLRKPSQIRTPRNSYLGVSTQSHWEFANRNAILVLANRCGVEDETTVFAGSSGIYKFNGKEFEDSEVLDSTNMGVELLGNLGKGKEGIIMRDVNFEVER